MWMTVVSDRNLKPTYDGGIRVAFGATEKEVLGELLTDFFPPDVLTRAVEKRGHAADVDLGREVSASGLKLLVEDCFEDRYPRADWSIGPASIQPKLLAADLLRQLQD